MGTGKLITESIQGMRHQWLKFGDLASYVLEVSWYELGELWTLRYRYTD